MGRRRDRRGRLLVAGGAVLALLLAACGGDNGGTAATTAGAATTAAGGATTTAASGTSTTGAGGAATTSAGGPASGEPVKVVSILDESDQVGITYSTKRAAMDAMVEAINDGGGLGTAGRPVELEYCVTQFDPNLAVKCGRDAIADNEVVALVGNITNYPDQINPLLEQAGMASIGTEPYGTGDGTSPNAFPIIAGYMSSVGGMAAVLADVAGAKNIKVVHVDTPSAQAAIGIAEQALAARGLKLAGAVPVPIGKQDVSAETATAVDGADGIGLLTDPTTANKVIENVKQLGAAVTVGGAGGQFSASALKGLGSAADGLLLANWFATDDTAAPGVKAFLDTMTKYDTVDNSDDLAKSGYTAMLLLATAAEGLSTIDRAGLLGALKVMKNFDTGGLTPPIDFTASGPLTLDGVALPRFVNPTVTYGKVASGKVQASGGGKFVNPFQAP